MDPEHRGAPYRDAQQPFDRRVADLLGRMTLEEKLAQMGCAWSTSLIRDGAFAPAKAKESLRDGIGHVTRIGGATVLRPAESAAVANAIQEFLLEETRLGIPAIIHEESCAGFLARDATCFPQAIGLASTWEPTLVQAMTDAIRQQMRAVGAHHALAPVLDVARDPRWGRTEETFGEDPYLIAQMGIAYVRGLQGSAMTDGVVATGKHFVGYGASEGGMNWAPAHLPWRELREIFVWPFEAVIREAGLASMMNGYHELDGVPCGASTALFRDLLRTELGFDGVVVTDYFTVHMLAEYHHIAADESEAAVRALEAGMDIELPALRCFGAPLRQALANGRVDPALIDAAVARVLRMKFQLGLFDDPYVEPRDAGAVFDTTEQRTLARRLAEKSLVLLKNDGLLPLRKDLRAVAVIGPSADSVRLLQGDYHYPAHLEIMYGEIKDGDLSPRPAGAGINLGLHFIPTVTVLEGIRAAVSAATAVHAARGCDIVDASIDGFAAAVAAAQQAEVAIVVVGERSGLVEGCTSGESVDRADLGLPGVQQPLVEAIVATGTPAVVVLINGRPLALPWIAEHVPAIVEAWIPGEESGHAIAAVLFGDVNPAGRLPLSVPRSVGQLPVFYNHKPSGGRSHWKGSYADLPTTPLFPFGHGLSFTTFSYDNFAIDPVDIDPHGTVRISMDIRNSGDRPGEEVVQLYVRDVVASVTRPVQELKGFARIAVEPGATRRVVFELAASQLAFFDMAMRYVVEPGVIEVMVGSSSADVRLRGTFTLVGQTTEIAGRQRYTTRVSVSGAP